MDKKLINQKEYLKKYLSSGKDKKKVKKKKPNLGSKTVTIIDDDIDLKNMRAIEDGEFDIYNTTEDGPQIAGIVDERGPVDFSDKRRWKIITDDGDGDITVTSVSRNEKISDESSPRTKGAAPNPVKNHSGSQDGDFSPPRRPKKDSDTEKPHKKKSAKKRRPSVSSPIQNRSGSQDSDFSPPRRPKKDSDPERTCKNKSSSKKRHRSGTSPVQNRSGSQDSDCSPPRRSRKNSDAEEPRRKKSSSKKRERLVSSPVQNRSESQDSDLSPPRRAGKNSDSDLSPPRNPKPKERREKNHKTRDDYTSNSGKKVESKYDKQRENSSKDWRRANYDDRNSRTRFSQSPSTEAPDFDNNLSRSKGRNDPYRAGKHASENNSSEYDKSHHRSRQDRNKLDSSRKKDVQASPRNRRQADGERRSIIHSQKGGNNSDSDLSPPREKKKKSKNFSMDFDPRENRKNSRNLHPESSLPEKTTFKNYQEMSAETSGFGQAPVLRDRKTGRRRDLAAEAREQEEKDGKRQELEEKYAQWGRGLKQVEDRQEKLDRDLYEMSKPLARYADDADLERELKAQDREGDPMLAYMKRKHVKEGKQEPEKPRYNGPSMPNRFGIRPGYRWDGVDRSNGYEKKWFEAQNARKAVQEEAYKWSTADM